MLYIQQIVQQSQIAGRVETLAAEHPHILRRVGRESCAPASAGDPAATHCAVRAWIIGRPHVRDGCPSPLLNSGSDVLDV